MERTCILVKPDGVGQRRVGKVLDSLETAGLRLVALKMTRLTAEQAGQFYKEHHGKPFYDALVRFMTSAPLVATAWEGDGAIAKARSLMGATNSTAASQVPYGVHMGRIIGIIWSTGRIHRHPRSAKSISFLNRMSCLRTAKKTGEQPEN